MTIRRAAGELSHRQPLRSSGPAGPGWPTPVLYPTAVKPAIRPGVASTAPGSCR
jgi:hypothetical protein